MDLDAGLFIDAVFEFGLGVVAVGAGFATAPLLNLEVFLEAAALAPLNERGVAFFAVG